MSNAENRRIELNQLSLAEADDCLEKVSVLYVAPIELDLQQSQFIQDRYAEMLDTDSCAENILSYPKHQNKNSTLLNLLPFLRSLFLFGLFLLRVRTEIKQNSIMHLFVFSSVSFIFQIIPLFIVGKFYRKQVVVEFMDFQNYYLAEEPSMLIRYFLKFADSVIVLSHRQSRILRQKGVNALKAKSHLNLTNISPRVIERVQPFILASAYLEDVFNVNCLLKAFKLVKQKYPRAELVIVGSGSKNEKIEELIAESAINGVTLKSADNFSEYLCKADLFVHCYHIEYFAQEILTAMAHGLPVMASPIGMVNDLIQKENILMYQFNDFSTLADNFLLLIEDDSFTKKLSQNGADFARAFSSKLSKNSVSSYYNNL